MNLFSVTQTSLASSPGNLYASQTEEDRIFDSTQLPWKQHLSATKERCNMVFDKLIIIFPEQLTPEKQDKLKKELKIDNDATLKMIVVMHFIVLKNKHCYKKTRTNIQTIELMRKINNVLFPGVTEKIFEGLYLQKLNKFDTSTIDKIIKGFSSEFIEKFKRKDINPKSKEDYFYIEKCKDLRNCVLHLARGITSTL